MYTPISGEILTDLTTALNCLQPTEYTAMYNPIWRHIKPDVHIAHQ